MTFTVIVEADAEQDWHEAVVWYDKREPGVSHRLNVAIREARHFSHPLFNRASSFRSSLESLLRRV